MVTPLGDGVDVNWRRLLAGHSGAGPITRFDASQMAARIACEVPRGDGSNGTFNADAYVAPKEQRRMDDFIIYGIAAAKQAIHRFGLDRRQRRRTLPRWCDDRFRHWRACPALNKRRWNWPKTARAGSARSLSPDV